MTSRALVAAAFSAALLLSSVGEASHFRGGTISWTVPNPVGAPRTVEFTVTSLWTLSSSSTQLFFGDGAVAPSNAGTQIGTFTGASGQAYQIRQYKVTYTYATNGPFTAYFSSCCRQSTLVGGGNDDSFRIQTVVDLNGSNVEGPAWSLTELLQMQAGGVRTITIPASDRDVDSMSCRLGTSGESGLMPAVPAVPTGGRCPRSRTGRRAAPSPGTSPTPRRASSTR